MPPHIALPALLNDAICFVHLLAVAVGLGASFFADFNVMRTLRTPVEQPCLDILHRCHRLVWVAMAGMWASGLVLVYLRTGFIWDSFSPKLISKIVVVCILTFNAWAIGVMAMRRIENWTGQSLLGMPMRVKLPMAIIAGVSTTSWLLALALGSSAVLAQSSASLLVPLIYGAYGLGVTLAICAVAALRFNPESDLAPA